MQIVSILFHPLLMPTIAFSILYFSYPESLSPITKESAPFLILAVFISTFIIPAMSLGALRITKTLKSLTLRERKDRIVPFVWIFVFYSFTSYLLINRLGVNMVIALIMIVATLLILALTTITLRFKISIHSAAMSGLAGFLVALSMHFDTNAFVMPMVGVVFIWGLVGTARLYLGAHSLKEVAFGGVFGFTFCFIPTLLYSIGWLNWL
jgi:membrane-associated phospholipid phosphatase